MATTTAPPEKPVQRVEPGSGTGSRTTRILGVACLVGVAVLGLFGFVLTEADLVQQDVVRMIYVHVPSAIAGYTGFVITAVASVMVLWKKSMWWDIVAVAGAEIGVLFTGLMLATGVIWGRPTWGTWWEWGDVRIMTALMLFLVYVGYLAYRRVVPSAEVRARRSAITASRRRAATRGTARVWPKQQRRPGQCGVHQRRCVRVHDPTRLDRDSRQPTSIGAKGKGGRERPLNGEAADDPAEAAAGANA